MKYTKEKVQVIQQRLKGASDRQKSSVDLKRNDIEYEVGYKVFLKVSPWRKILRFGKKGKLSPSVDPQFCPSTLAFILLVSHSPIVLI